LSNGIQTQYRIRRLRNRVRSVPK